MPLISGFFVFKEKDFLLQQFELALADYGIAFFNSSALGSFLKAHRVRKQKLLDLFSDEHALYLDSLATGAWLPIPEINAMKYQIFCQQAPDEHWQHITQYAPFNLSIADDAGLWAVTSGMMNRWQAANFHADIDVIDYQTWQGETLNKAGRLQLPRGNYQVAIVALQHQQTAQFGYWLHCTQVPEFDDYQDPREARFAFNVAARSD